MKHKVSELTGSLLDAAVAKAEGRDVAELIYSAHSDSERDWSPSTEWADGGPIIERERITTGYCDEGPWMGSWFAQYERPFDMVAHHTIAPTPLIAAMRAYVASRFGEEVDL